MQLRLAWALLLESKEGFSGSDHKQILQSLGWQFWGVRGLVFGHESCLAYRILVSQAGIEPGPPSFILTTLVLILGFEKYTD